MVVILYLPPLLSASSLSEAASVSESVSASSVFVSEAAAPLSEAALSPESPEPPQPVSIPAANTPLNNKANILLLNFMFLPPLK